MWGLQWRQSKSELVYREIQFHLDYFSERCPGQCGAELQAWNWLLLLWCHPWSSGLSSGSNRIWGNIPWIPLLIATEFTLNLNITARRGGSSTGPGSNEVCRRTNLDVSSCTWISYSSHSDRSRRVGIGTWWGCAKHLKLDLRSCGSFPNSRETWEPHCSSKVPFLPSFSSMPMRERTLRVKIRKALMYPLAKFGPFMISVLLAASEEYFNS